MFDMEALAQQSGTIINAVMLGAIAGSGRLPIPAETFEAAIREGRAAEGNLRGFRAGFEAVRGQAAPGTQPSAKRPQPLPIAIEVAECARLIKGYGDTHKRGTGNYRLIEERVIRPVIAGVFPLRRGVDAIASARTAALVDPEGESLAKCLAELDGAAGMKIAAE